MAKSYLKQQNTTIMERTKKRVFLLMIFLLLMTWFGISLVTAESPESWKETDITVTDVHFISGKSSRYQITDTLGNTYAIASSNRMIDKITPGSTYHILYSTNFHNGIRSMAQADLVIVDYENSISTYSDRGALTWVLFFIGLTGSVVTISITIIDIRKEIAYKTQTH